MRVEVFYNESRAQFGFEFEPVGSELRIAYDGQLDFMAAPDMSASPPQVTLAPRDYEQVAEELFHTLGNNAGATKPDGFRDRSMCCGDVLRFTDRLGLRTVLVCEHAGFTRRDPEHLAELLDSAPLMDFETYHALVGA